METEARLKETIETQTDKDIDIQKWIADIVTERIRKISETNNRPILCQLESNGKKFAPPPPPPTHFFDKQRFFL